MANTILRLLNARRDSLVLSLLLVSLAGCAGNRFAGFEWRNPFQTIDTSYKKSYGLTPAEISQQIRQLGEDVASMPPEEQQKTAEKLTRRYQAENDPLMRRDIVFALGAFPDPIGAKALQAAMADTDRFVRAEACRGWARRSSEEALQALVSMIQSDASVDVRQAAIEGVKRFKHPEAIRALGAVLQERDPAMQYLAMQSLKGATDRDFGNDANKWNEYVASAYPAPENSSVDQQPWIAESPDTDAWR